MTGLTDLKAELRDYADSFSESEDGLAFGILKDGVEVYFDFKPFAAREIVRSTSNSSTVLVGQEFEVRIDLLSKFLPEYVGFRRWEAGLLDKGYQLETVESNTRFGEYLVVPLTDNADFEYYYSQPDDERISVADTAYWTAKYERVTFKPEQALSEPERFKNENKPLQWRLAQSRFADYLDWVDAGAPRQRSGL